MFFGQGRIVSRDLAGSRAGILIRDFQEFLFAVSIFVLLIDIGELAGIRWFPGSMNPRLKNLQRVIESRAGLGSLPPRIRAPAEDRQSHDQRRADDHPQNLLVRGNGLNTMNETLTYLVFLQILAQNMLRHRFTPPLVLETAIVSQVGKLRRRCAAHSDPLKSEKTLPNGIGQGPFA